MNSRRDQHAATAAPTSSIADTRCWVTAASPSSVSPIFAARAGRRSSPRNAGRKRALNPQTTGKVKSQSASQRTARSAASGSNGWDGRGNSAASCHPSVTARPKNPAKMRRFQSPRLRPWAEHCQMRSSATRSSAAEASGQTICQCQSNSADVQRAATAAVQSAHIAHPTPRERNAAPRNLGTVYSEIPMMKVADPAK